MRLKQLPLSILLLSFAGSLLTGCAMTANSPGNPELPYPPQKTPEIGDILHLPTGVFVSQEQMLDAATDSRLVYVGETHDNPASHRLQLQVLAAMAARYPGNVSLGMEMFDTDQQPALDRWVQGKIDEKTFLQESAWYKNWRMDFDYYRDLLLFARDNQIPVIGLNAPDQLVDSVSKTPLAALSPELLDQLPEMDMADPYQRALSEAVFADHGAGENAVEGFLRVQTLWDEAMAEKIVETLRQNGQEHRMVVLAGGNHVRNGFGIPRRVFRRLPVSYTLIGGDEIKIPENLQNRFMNIEMPGFPMPAYHYLVYTEYETLPDDRVKLGVRMQEQEGRVVVENVVPDSSADLAGVLAGDIIVRLDAAEIAEMFDLVFEIRQKRLGDEAVLIVERNGETLELPVVFKPLPEGP